MIEIEELSKRKLAALDEMFEEYQTVDHELSKREFELRYPWTPTDTNIGGGRSAMRTDGPDKTMEAIQSDPRMIYLRRIKKACGDAVDHMSDDQLEVYNKRYEIGRNYSWSDMPELLHLTRATVYRKRYGILSLLASELGYLT